MILIEYERAERSFILEQPDRLVQATRFAIRQARLRNSNEVTPDDLLIGLLQQISRFGVAQIGPLAIDVEVLGELSASPSLQVRPAYTAESVALFERAARIARLDNGAETDLVHLLVAFAGEEGGLFKQLQEQYGFTPFGWRAALAGWETPAAPAGQSGQASPAQQSEGEALMTTEEAAIYLGVHPQTIRGYIRFGKLPAFRVAGERSIRIRRTDLQSLLERVPVGEV